MQLQAALMKHDFLFILARPCQLGILLSSAHVFYTSNLLQICYLTY